MPIGIKDLSFNGPLQIELKDLCGKVPFVSAAISYFTKPPKVDFRMTKAAESALARNLAVEYGPSNIRVNAIAPGLVKTDFAKALWEDPVYRKKQESVTPLRRIGLPEDIAGVAHFLASPASAYLTGQSLVVDGGETITSL